MSLGQKKEAGPAEPGLFAPHPLSAPVSQDLSQRPVRARVVNEANMRPPDLVVASWIVLARVVPVDDAVLTRVDRGVSDVLRQGAACVFQEVTGATRGQALVAGHHPPSIRQHRRGG